MHHLTAHAPTALRRALGLAIVAAALVAAPAQAQRRYGAVTGYVTDTAGLAVPRAEVAILGSVEHRAFTDSSGRFRFYSVGPGDHVIVARRIGFIARSFMLEIAPADTSQVVLELEPFVTDLPTVNVTAQQSPSRFDEVRHRQLYSMGSFITREDIEFKKPRQTSDLLRRELGIEVGSELGHTMIFSTRGVMPSLGVAGLGGPRVGGIASGRTDSTSNRGTEQRQIGQGAVENVNVRCVIPIVLDSQLMPDGFSIDDIVPSEIEIIEIYKGLATLPIQYARKETQCGVIVVWTREGEIRRRGQAPKGTPLSDSQVDSLFRKDSAGKKP